MTIRRFLLLASGLWLTTQTALAFNPPVPESPRPEVVELKASLKPVPEPTSRPVSRPVIHLPPLRFSAPVHKDALALAEVETALEQDAVVSPDAVSSATAATETAEALPEPFTPQMRNPIDEAPENELQAEEALPLKSAVKPEPQNSLLGVSFAQWLRLGLGLGMVLILMMLFFKLALPHFASLKQFKSKAEQLTQKALVPLNLFQDNKFQVLSSTKLGPGLMLYLVQIKAAQLVLSVTPSQISLLTEFRNDAQTEITAADEADLAALEQTTPTAMLEADTSMAIASTARPPQKRMVSEAIETTQPVSLENLYQKYLNTNKLASSAAAPAPDASVSSASASEPPVATAAKEDASTTTAAANIQYLADYDDRYSA